MEVLNKMNGRFVTPFTDMNGAPIFVGDNIRDTDYKFNRDIILIVKFGQFESNTDDWGIKYCPYGFYVTYPDGTTNILNQNGDGYAVAACKCEIIISDKK